MLFVGWSILGAPYSQEAMAKHIDMEDEMPVPRGYSFLQELKIPPQKLYNFINIQIVITQRDIDLVQQHELDVWIADQLFGLGPTGLRSRDVALFVLGFPGKPFSAGHPGYLVCKVIGKE